jgi:hypothetical protein
MRARAVFRGLWLVLAVASAALGCDAGPKALTPDEIVAAFVSQNSAADRAFHVDVQGSMRMSGLGGGAQASASTFTGGFDYSGEDYVGTLRSAMGAPGGGMTGFASSVSYTRVGGVSFVRYQDSPWERGGGPAGMGMGSAMFDPIRGLTAADVSYEAPESLDDRPLHRIRILDPAAAMKAALDTGVGAGLTADPQGSEYILYLDPAGVPVGAQVLLVGQLDFGDPALDLPMPQMPQMRYQMTFTYQFSAWGSEIAISLPT